MKIDVETLLTAKNFAKKFGQLTGRGERDINFLQFKNWLVKKEISHDEYPFEEIQVDGVKFYRLLGNKWKKYTVTTKRKKYEI